ncbi:thioredoxin family protein [Tropicimonas sp. IMCC6043]|uniref:DUF1223 domain-containing protein n=1 Tax=Tropicimonas sp. IMCC6043 TaxID=2510645 RepID=UPI00101D083C|nr:DUF1223 domain-containing protein [Tropicimonas sp. IMCC6043]RYH09829.1 DUF1223 domain-containing protein [Tropicimonas sp. IMCC6043]
MRAKTLIAGLVAAMGLLWQTPAAQADPGAKAGPVVVELFTSQGCSSCPPADALLQELAERSDVLPLALHVDYWDYIGWKDSFARPEHTARQKRYAHSAGSRTIYTPQMVVGGVDQIVGTRPMAVTDAVMRHLQMGPVVDLSARRSGDSIRVTAPKPDVPGNYRVQLVRFLPEKTVRIERGENAGQTMEYINIVTDWRVLGDWSGLEPLDMSFPVPGPEKSAVIVQQAKQGAIVGALRLP